MEVGGCSPELRLGQLHERLVGGILQRGAPEEGAHDPDRLVAHAAQGALVGHDPRPDERRLALQGRLRVLLDEPHGLTGHEDGAHGVDIRLDLRQIRREVEHVQRHPELLDDLAPAVLEDPLEPADLLVPERIVHGDGGHAAVLEGLRRVVAERMHDLARREVRAEEPLGDLALGQVVGRGEEERGELVALDERDEAIAHVGEEDAGEDVDLVVADELPVLRDGRGRVALRVLLEQLDLAPARLVADLLERELEAVEHVLACLGEDPRERAEESDADRLRGSRRTRRKDEQGQGHGRDDDDADELHALLLDLRQGSQAGR